MSAPQPGRLDDLDCEYCPDCGGAPGHQGGCVCIGAGDPAPERTFMVLRRSGFDHRPVNGEVVGLCEVGLCSGFSARRDREAATFRKLEPQR